MNMPIAITLIVTGILLLLFGLGAANSMQSAFSRFFTGHPTDRAMWLIIVGGVALVAGIVGYHKNRRI